MSKKFDTNDKHHYNKYNTDTQYYKTSGFQTVIWNQMVLSNQV